MSLFALSISVLDGAYFGGREGGVTKGHIGLLEPQYRLAVRTLKGGGGGGVTPFLYSTSLALS